MKLFKLTGLILVAVIFLNCKSKLPESFHMDKRFWDIHDYEVAINQIRYATPKEEGYPRLSDPITSKVFMKLVDKQNVSIILEDKQLGIKYKNEVAQKFFDISKEIIEIYQALDVQDRFVYPLELVKAIEFGLHTQLLYFKVGNDEIIKDAINPDASEIKGLVKSNEQIIANNFNNYIMFLTKADAFNESANKEYAEMINIYFTKLIKEFPSADYSTIKNTAKSIIIKVKSPVLKKSLEDLVVKIDTRK
jgi:hypothetical protein